MIRGRNSKMGQGKKYTVKVLDRKPHSGRAFWRVWDIFRTLPEAMAAAEGMKQVKVFEDGNRCVHHRGGEEWGT